MGASASTQDTPENRWMVFVVSAITQFNARAILEIQSAFDKDSIVISDKTGQYLGTLTGMAVKIPTKLLAPGVGIDTAAGAVAEKGASGAWDKYQRSKRYKSAKMIQRWLPGMYVVCLFVCFKGRSGYWGLPSSPFAWRIESVFAEFPKMLWAPSPPGGILEA